MNALGWKGSPAGLTGRSMSSLLDGGLVRTLAVERVVAPIAGHMCHLMLLCDGDDDPERFGQLEEAALAVARATDALAAAAAREVRPSAFAALCAAGTLQPNAGFLRLSCRAASAAEDEASRAEMWSLLESVALSGQHVLLAAQKLAIQPAVAEHREELVGATQNVFLGVVKVEYSFSSSERLNARRAKCIGCAAATSP